MFSCQLRDAAPSGILERSGAGEIRRAFFLESHESLTWVGSFEVNDLHCRYKFQAVGQRHFERAAQLLFGHAQDMRRLRRDPGCMSHGSQPDQKFG
jgi:hypothetical protein